MFRMTTLKISLFSALATLMLLIAMLATSGTASAHTASSQTKASHPHIEVNDVTPTYGNCDEVSLNGFGFAPGQIKLFASQHNHPITVLPGNLFTNGSFSDDVTVCGDFGLGYGHNWGYGNGHNWGHGHNWGYGYCPGYGYGWSYGNCWDYAPIVLVAVGPYGVPSNHVIL